MRGETFKFNAEFLDTETDEIVTVFTFSAKSQREAENIAHDEAEYQGYHVGSVSFA